VSAGTEIAVLSGRALRHFVRTRGAVISAFVFPVLLLFVQLAVFGGVVGAAEPGRYVDRFAPLTALTTAAYGASATAIALFFDLRSGFLARLRTMPVHPVSLLAGRILGDLARTLMLAVLTTVIAHAAGFRFSRGPVAAAAFFGVAVLFGAICTSVAVLIAVRASGIETIIGLLVMPTTLLFFLSSGFVPVWAFPGALQPIVRANPMSVADNAMIGLSSGGPVAVPVVQIVAWSAGVSAVCGLLAVRRYRALTG
jgi:ABC-2 type transport system permease protein